MPDIGELMLASFPSDRFNDDISPENSWYYFIQLQLFYIIASTLCISLFRFVSCLFIYFYFNIRWIGEKYDGIRVCWHPELRHLYPFNHLVPPSLPYSPLTSPFVSRPTLLPSFLFFLFILTYWRYARSGMEVPLPVRFRKFFSRAFMDCEIWYYILFLSPPLSCPLISSSLIALPPHLSSPSLSPH